jgi:uncharacterized coiled-coil DUF342 family protein
MELPIIVSLSISGVVAAVQIINFFESRDEKKQSKQNQYAKADVIRNELDDIISNMERQKSHCHDVNSKLAAKVIIHNQDIAVMKVELNNEIKNTSKLLDKLNDELDNLIREHK